MGRVIGIDLGTSYSVAAIAKKKQVRLIPGENGEFLIPSVFGETETGEPLVGHAAKAFSVKHFLQTVFSIKRHMGEAIRVSVNGHSYAPQEICSFILKKIKTNAENYLGEPVDRAVITVPAYFNHAAREATREAGTIAGFNVMRIINEPTAAALAYGLHRQEIRTVLVWDLGGGTFDVSILELSEGFFQVMAVNGDNRLGGDDWDQRLVDHTAGRFMEAHGFDPRQDTAVHGALRQACEKAKRQLSIQPAVPLSLSRIAGPDGSVIDFHTELAQDTFDALTQDLTQRLISPTKRALSDANLDVKEINRILLVGGATRMPAIRQLAEAFFGQGPYLKINPDEVVAMGAAIQAGILEGEIQDVVLIDVTPLSLGIESQGGLFARIIPRNNTIPCSASQIFTTAKDHQTHMDIHVLQGEREMAVDNISLGRFQLTGIPSRLRAQAHVEVCFAIDANSLVTVSAQDLQTESQASIAIDALHLLTEKEIQKAVENAKAFAIADKKKREQVEMAIKTGIAPLGMEN